MSIGDAANLGTLITATAAAIVSIIVALRQNGAIANVREIREEVRTTNGTSLGEIVEANDLRGPGHHDPPAG